MPKKKDAYKENKELENSIQGNIKEHIVSNVPQVKINYVRPGHFLLPIGLPDMTGIFVASLYCWTKGQHFELEVKTPRTDLTGDKNKKGEYKREWYQRKWLQEFHNLGCYAGCVDHWKWIFQYIVCPSCNKAGMGNICIWCGKRKAE